MKGIASVLAAQGRGEDSVLVHMTPKEVGALHGLASLQGVGLSTNPVTGLPEAGILSQFLPMLAGAALTYFTGGAYGALGAAGAGAATGYAQTGTIGGAIGGGLGGWGGGSLASGLMGAGAASAVGTEAGLMPLASEGIGAGMSVNPALVETPLTLLPAEGAAAVEAPLQTTAARMTALPQGTMSSPLPSPGVDPTTLSTSSPTMDAIKKGIGYNSDQSLIANLWSPGTTGGITGKGGITPLGAGLGLGAASLMGSQADAAAKKAAEERLRRGDPYSPDSMYQQSIARARSQPAPWHAAAGGITGSYPNRVPEREVVPDATAPVGTEPQVDPFTGQQQMAGGGVAGHPRYLNGAGDGMSDSIPAHIDGKQPAALATSEFVVPADVVSHLGNGSSEAGAKQLYAMMDRIRKARTGHTKQGKQINARKLMAA